MNQSAGVGITTPQWICIAGLTILVLMGLVYMFPDPLRSICDRFLSAFSRRSRGQRIAAQWRKCAARRKLSFSQNILTQNGDIIGALPQDRLTLAFIELVSWQSQLNLTVSGAMTCFWLISAFTVSMFFFGYTLNYPPFIMNGLQAYGLVFAMHLCVIIGCVGIVLMFLINIRLTLLRGLVNAVKKKITAALAIRTVNPPDYQAHPTTTLPGEAMPEAVPPSTGRTPRSGC